MAHITNDHHIFLGIFYWVGFITLGDLYGVIEKGESHKRKGREVGTLKSLVNN
jgi:cbb3-type cytochrome oxidase subunit 1